MASFTTTQAQTEQDWQREIVTREFGEKTLAESLGRIISHTAHHGGQMAVILRYAAAQPSITSDESQYRGVASSRVSGTTILKAMPATSRLSDYQLRDGVRIPTGLEAELNINLENHENLTG